MTEAADHRAGRARLVRASAAVLLVFWLSVCGISFAQSASSYAQTDPSAAPRGTRLTPSVSTELLWTDNVSLNTGDERQSDLVLTITPRLRVEHVTDRTLLRGTVSVPLFIYARTGEANNQALPEVDLLGRAELVDRFFFLEAAANVYQQFFNPFGPRPEVSGNRVANQYTAQNYRISPYIEGRPTGALHYVLRNDNIWSNLSDTPSETGNFYTNILTGSIERDPTPLGWAFDVSRKDYDFEDQSRSQVLALARARGIWQPDPQLRMHASAGYEQNRFPFSRSDGAIYGAGIFWRPTERTVVNASWEHRFFGASYEFLFQHRAPNFSWSAQAYRNISSYPEQLANLPAGTFVPGVLNAIFASRIADPIERARFIGQYMQDRGLPLFLSDPQAIFSQQVYLVESANTSFGIIGVRNSIVFNVYYLKTEAITGQGEPVPPQLDPLDNNRQVGISASWAYQVSPVSTLTLTTNAVRTEANPPFTGKSDQWSTELRLTRPISPRTTAYAGARHQSFKSDFEPAYTETAVFIGASYEFR